MKFTSILALIATVSAVRVNQLSTEPAELLQLTRGGGRGGQRGERGGRNSRDQSNEEASPVPQGPQGNSSNSTSPVADESTQGSSNRGGRRPRRGDNSTEGNSTQGNSTRGGGRPRRGDNSTEGNSSRGGERREGPPSAAQIFEMCDNAGNVSDGVLTLQEALACAPNDRIREEIRSEWPEGVQNITEEDLQEYIDERSEEGGERGERRGPPTAAQIFEMCDNAGNVSDGVLTLQEALACAPNDRIREEIRAEWPADVQNITEEDLQEYIDERSEGGDHHGPPTAAKIFEMCDNAGGVADGVLTLEEALDCAPNDRVREEIEAEWPQDVDEITEQQLQDYIDERVASHEQQ